MQEWTTYDADDVAAGLQEFLICVEMFFAALAHAHSFPPRDYMDPAGSVPRGFKQNIRIMFDVTDVVDDVQGVVDDTVSTLVTLPLPASCSAKHALVLSIACAPKKSYPPVTGSCHNCRRCMHVSPVLLLLKWPGALCRFCRQTSAYRRRGRPCGRTRSGRPGARWGRPRRCWRGCTAAARTLGMTAMMTWRGFP